MIKHPTLATYLLRQAGFSYQELADILRVPVGTVRSRISRTRDFIRRKQCE